MSVDAATVAGLEDAVRALPGVTSAVTLVRPGGPGGTAPADTAWRPGGAGRAGPGGPAPARARAGGEPWSPAISSGGPRPPAPDRPGTVPGILRAVAAAAPDRLVAFVGPGGEHRSGMAAVLASAARMGSAMHGMGLRRGDPVLIRCEDVRNLVTAVWACLLGGLLPTPVPPPARPGKVDGGSSRMRELWRLLRQPPILTDARLLAAQRSDCARWRVDRVRIEAVEDLADAVGPDAGPAGLVLPEDPALILVAGEGRLDGVVWEVRHRHLTGPAPTGTGPDEVGLTWLPMHSPVGLLGHLRDVVDGRASVVVHPALDADPLGWLASADRFGATSTTAPAVALVRAADRIDGGPDRGWDLSRLHHIHVPAGDVLRPAAAHRFVRLLARYGLPADAVRPEFGRSLLGAEVTAGRLSLADPAAGTLHVDRASVPGPVRLLPAGPAALALAVAGPPVRGASVRVVDGDGAALAEDEVGLVHVLGEAVPSVRSGGSAEEQVTFADDGWLVTDTLAFLHRGELVVLGTPHDVLTVDGATHLSSEVETVAEQVAGTVPTWTAACAMSGRLVVFLASAEPGGNAARRSAVGVRHRVETRLGLRPALVLPVPEAAFRRSPSGSLRRDLLVADLTAGRFDELLDADPAGPGEDGTEVVVVAYAADRPLSTEQQDALSAGFFAEDDPVSVRFVRVGQVPVDEAGWRSLSVLGDDLDGAEPR